MTIYSKNEKNTNDIIKFFISKGIEIKFTCDIRYYKEVDWYSPDITISPIIKGLPSFQFWYSLNNEVNNMYMHLRIPSDIYNKNINKWLSDFQGEFLTLTIDNDEANSVIFKGYIEAKEMSNEVLEKLYAFLITRSPIMNEIIACSKEFNEEEINYLETSTNEENTNTILEFFIKNGIDYTLDLDTDDSDKTNVQTQIQIDLKIDGLPNFAFFYNAKTDDVICYRTVLTINEKVLDDNFADWEREFKPNDIFSDLIKSDDDNTVHFYGEVPQKDFSEEKLKTIIDYLTTRSPLMDKIISLSEEVK